MKTKLINGDSGFNNALMSAKSMAGLFAEMGIYYDEDLQDLS